MGRPKKLDPATEKIFTRGEHLKSLTEHAGWSEFREMLLRKVASLINLSDITTPDAKTIVALIVGRQEASKVLLAWLADIEGTVQQHKANLGAYDAVKDEYIISMDDLKSDPV